MRMASKEDNDGPNKGAGFISHRTSNNTIDFWTYKLKIFIYLLLAVQVYHSMYLEFFLEISVVCFQSPKNSNRILFKDSRGADER